MNEEKIPIWFVWEKTIHGGMVTHLNPAVYRGMPRTGLGERADNARFIFKHQALAEEQNWKLNQFIEKYPSPEAQNDVKSEEKKKHTGSSFAEGSALYGVSGEDYSASD